MRGALLTMVLVLLVSLVPLGALSMPAVAQEEIEDGDTLPPIGSEVIVVLEDGDDPVAAAAEMGVEIRHIYKHVFTGFSGVVIPVQETPNVARARKQHKPKLISLDGEVEAESQVIPTGVSRAGVPKDPNGQNLAITPPTTVDIAIIDTGIAPLSDLNVQGGFSCIGGNSNAWQDDNGHGTHVAGIAAAKDNDVGVVGVAPGARLWAVKVLDSSGGGAFSDVICGLDWVAGQRNVIDIANLSLSGGQKRGDCTAPALHLAVCTVVAAGIPVIVAAGNQGINADQRVPASYPEVITVSGIADSDGRPGRLGPKPCFAEKDDMFLNFTNFGASVDIAAPGACIVSYGLSGELVSESGTSEASPHVAGAAADFIFAFQNDHGGQNPTPDQVRNWLLNTASRPQSVDGVTGNKDSREEKSKEKNEKIKKAKKKVKKAKGKNAKQNAKKKLKKVKRQKVKDGHLEPVLWLASLT